MNASVKDALDRVRSWNDAGKNAPPEDYAIVAEALRTAARELAKDIDSIPCPTQRGPLTFYRSTTDRWRTKAARVLELTGGE